LLLQRVIFQRDCNDSKWWFKQSLCVSKSQRPEYTGTVKVAGLLNKANIKITDIEGNLVYETTSEGGTTNGIRPF
jgi:hypothetical protein